MHTVVLTRIIRYITSLVRIYLVTGSWYLLTTFLQSAPLPPLPLVTTNLISKEIFLTKMLTQKGGWVKKREVGQPGRWPEHGT